MPSRGPNPRSHSAAFIILSAIAFIFCAWAAWSTLEQPLVDAHAFRQTQTALTAWWIRKTGFLFAYETPVAGYPWSIPFEFPLYQLMVSGLSTIFDSDLVLTGRLISWVFLIACLWPACELASRLSLPRSVPIVFCALMWTAPLHVYWGRTFMIETAALFFTLSALPFGLDVIRREGGMPSIALFWFLSILAVLQKATTAGPLLLFLIVLSCVLEFRKVRTTEFALSRLLINITILTVPLIVGFFWTRFSDQVKLTNPLGAAFTSTALRAWNFGTPAQRFDLPLWRDVVWQRALVINAGGLIGLMLIALPWIFRRGDRRYAYLSGFALVLFVLPLLIFTNLHIVHEYYQVACVAFLLASIAIVIGAWIPQISGRIPVAPLCLLLLIVINITNYKSAYGIVSTRSVDQSDKHSAQAYRVGRYLQSHTPEDTGIVVFGQDWSSEIAFHSERRSMTAPSWFSDHKTVWRDPQAFLGSTPLAAIVLCPPSDNFPTAEDLKVRAEREAGWTLQEVSGCFVLLRSS
jgi:hypothetical protein